MDPLYDALALSARPWLRLAIRWRIDGAEHIPRSGPALVASNHISYADPLVAAFVALERGRRARFLSKQELFRPPLGLALRALGQIEVARGTSSAGDSLVHAKDALGRGECVIIFPEGTISHETFEPIAFKTGVGRLMESAPLPAIPMAIWGAHRLATKGRRPTPRPGVEVRVVVGEPVTAEEGESAAETSARVRTAVVHCLRRAQADYSQGPLDSEGDWWLPRPEPDIADAPSRRSGPKKKT